MRVRPNALALALLLVGGCQRLASGGGDSTTSASSTSEDSTSLSSSSSTNETSEDSGTTQDGGWEPLYDLQPDWACDGSPEECADDEKCRPCSRDGWAVCQPLADAPGSKGEVCAAFFVDDMIYDDCDVDLVCVEGGGSHGICAERCVGGWPDGICAGEGEVCSLLGSLGCSSLCLPSCDPLAPNCAAGTDCIYIEGGAVADTPVCMASVPDWASLGVGESCSMSDVFACGAGLMCSDWAALPDCSPDGETGCCLPYCDLSMPSCPFADQGVECRALMEPLAGHEELGVCR